MQTIQVTQAHITKGHRDSCYFCPIALAIKDVVGDGASGDGLFVGPTIVGKGHKLLPKKARAFIRAFDAGRPVKPFSFTLDL